MSEDRGGLSDSIVSEKEYLWPAKTIQWYTLMKDNDWDHLPYKPYDLACQQGNIDHHMLSTNSEEVSF